jgi:GDPmannose 4,6-dehydratase
LAELLLQQGYQVIGTARTLAKERLRRIEHIQERIALVEDDLLNQARLEELIRRFRPTEVYNLAARASSADLSADPVSTGEINALAVVRLLEAIRVVDPTIRFFQALSAELFGFPSAAPQSELAPLQPQNMYAVAKQYAYSTVKVYRQMYGIHASSAILFNHESPRRDKNFVTRKITHAVALIHAGRQRTLELGSLNAARDWSFAGDFVRAMWLMVQHQTADDYVLASGTSHTVGDYCRIAFERMGLDFRDFVRESETFARAADTTLRVGNAEKARKALGWQPEVDFEGLVRMMVDHDVDLLTKK